MAYYMHIAAGDGDHRLCIRRFVMWCKNRLMKTGNNQISESNILPLQSISHTTFLMLASMPRRIPTPSTTRGQIRMLMKCQ